MTAGVFHYEQSMALKQHCDVALYFPYDTDADEEFSDCIERGLLTWRRKMHDTKQGHGHWIGHTLRTIADLRAICKQYQPDVIHAHCCLPAGRAAVLFGKLYGYPVVITEHSPIEQMYLNSRSAKAQMTFTYGNSAGNICVSQDSMERLQKIFPDCNYQVIYNGIIAPDAAPADGIRYAVDGKINCSIVAAFYSKEIKGYQFLLPAVQMLRRKGIEIVLHICGGGDYLEYYRNMAEELGIQDSCIFYGQCDKRKVYTILSQMDFCISASIFECSGVSVEEAMLLGKPLVVTRSGGANSLVTEVTAIVVDRGAAEPLADGIERMIQSLDKYDSETIREYAYRNFEIGHVSRQYLQVYEQVRKNK